MFFYQKKKRTDTTMRLCFELEQTRAPHEAVHLFKCYLLCETSGYQLCLSCYSYLLVQKNMGV